MNSKNIAKNDKDIKDLGTPLNYNERLQYASLMRLDALCDMLSSIIEYIASKENVAVEMKTVVEEEPKAEPKKANPKRKTTKKGD